ncbi:hypothetical protein MP638_005476 [Amoeboaphelidium occidentale]|nr:hypothetical protein MP638_005476 [Amoeboaphelidium occidentale]
MNKFSKVFGFSVEEVRIISTPEEFYGSILKGLENAQHRVTLSSLYLGTGEKERHLVSCMQKTLERNDSKFKLSLLFDHLRGTRGEVNSVSLLKPLLNVETSAKLQLYLYHTHNLNGWMKRIVPERFNEIFGLQHMKIYVFDDEVILSGANLSDTYFSNRQDRYYVFKSKPLADFLDDLVQTISSLSYQVESTGNFLPPPIDPVSHAPEYSALASSNMNDFLTKWESKADVVCEIKDMGNFIAKEFYSNDSETLAFPLVQMGCFGLTQDEDTIENIFERLQTNANNIDKLILTSGYFNLTDVYQKLILASVNPVRILVSSEESNGFFGAKGIAGYVPSVYSHLLSSFMEQVRSESKENKISVYEYTREGWSFHAKGFWLYRNDIDELTPFATAIGSPNFGERSSKLDLESQVLVVTKDQNLRDRMRQEMESLFQYSHGIDGRQEVDKKPPVPFWLPAVSNFLKSKF